ncbi:putative FAD dependent oxidoreductase [Streptococcus milleri]|uniref:NAD(P)/FAD-dependent oxidoreductase n=1 Tax=Streptococcus milleri TaxID=33040 RepID=UPI000F70D437|nr:FAD-dependent oxidoreductase [Streptococcus milleri]VEE82314.1 putative FAD dependent oxidoreductase [Streptococcus milleri]
MKKVAIIGAGIVGSTAAYYLSKNSIFQVTIFDHGIGQATKAAAGIISPWFSKRRNKAWYRMARLGADFYLDLIADLQKDGFATKFYQQTGVFLLKKKEKSLETLYELANQRRHESQLIGNLQLFSRAEATEYFPGLQGFDRLLYASGGARVDGSLLTQILLAASGANLIQKKVNLDIRDDACWVNRSCFDQVILATGAWLPELLKPLGYQVDIRPQKGQLRDYQTNLVTDDYPVVMPEGELDIIPFQNGKISMGATHENEMGYDLRVDQDLLDKMEQEAFYYFPSLSQANRMSERVGIRAYTSDFSPFFGQVPDLSQVFAASGLGSSGLTTGPLIGYHLAQMVQGKSGSLNPADYPIERYIKKEK